MMKLASLKNTGIIALLCIATAAASYAADAPVAPAADKSADQSADQPAAPSANDAQAPAAAKPQSSAPDRKPLSASALPRSSTSPSSSVPGTRPGTRKTADRLDLDTTNVTGNRELPKVLYIVPWKKADIGELPAQPFNTLLDEVLTPVDRDVFRREVTYYGAVAAGTGAAAGAAAPVSNSSHGSEK